MFGELDIQYLYELDSITATTTVATTAMATAVG